MHDTRQSQVARDLPTVMPAPAGIQGRVALGFKLTWIPAFAGMTETEASGDMSLNLCAPVCPSFATVAEAFYPPHPDPPPSGGGDLDAGTTTPWVRRRRPSRPGVADQGALRCWWKLNEDEAARRVEVVFARLVDDAQHRLVLGLGPKTAP